MVESNVVARNKDFGGSELWSVEETTESWNAIEENVKKPKIGSDKVECS